MQPQMHIQKFLYGCGTNLLLERICVQIKLPHLGERVSGCRGADLPSERLAEIFVHEPAFRAGKIIDTHQARPDALLAPVRNAEHLVPALQKARLFLLRTVGFSKLHHHAAELTGVSASVLENVVAVCAYGNLWPDLHTTFSLLFIHFRAAEVDHTLAGINFKSTDVRLLL